MAERQKLEVTVLNQSFSDPQKQIARDNIAAAAQSALFGLSAKTISKIETTDTVTATQYTATDGTIYYKLDAAPEVSDTIIKPENGLYASQQNTTWTIGISADYLSANALNNYSANWQNTYDIVNTNSAKWNEVTAFSSNSGKFALNTDVDNKFTATSAWAKETFASASQLNDYYKKTETSANGELDTAFDKKQDKLTTEQLSAISSVSSIKSDLATHVDDTDVHIQDGERDKWNTVSSKADKSYVDKGLADTSAWAKETFQPIGEYLSANALDDLSGHWDSVYESVLANSASWNETSATLNTNSGKWEQAFTAVSSNSGYWDSVYNSVLANSASWDETSAVVNENSGFWGQAYTALTSTSATWNNHSALSATKLDKDAFEEWSATTETWDKIYYSGAEGIKVDEHIISISADYLSANALDDYSGKWNSVYDSVFDNSASWNETSATLKENSGKWEESYTALTATSATWNNHSALSATKLDVSAFDTWKNDEFEPVKTDVETLKANSAHYPVESTNEYITVNSADHKFALTFVSGDLATKTWVDELISNYGYHECTGNEIKANGEPDENVLGQEGYLSSTKVYLVKDNTVTGIDKYKEWIWVAGLEPYWKCIGDTSMDLTPYLKISAISGVSGNWNSSYNYVTANSGNIAEASAIAIDVSNTVNTYSSNWQESYEALTSTSANWNNVYNSVNANSATWNNHSALSAEVEKKLDASESANYMLISKLDKTANGITGYDGTAIYIPEYSGKDGIKVENYEISISAEESELIGGEGIKLETVDDQTIVSISANYLSANALNSLSGDWEDVYNTVNTNSAAWNEVSAFSSNSGKFVTSGNEIVDDKAYVLTNDGNSVIWSGIDLSDLGKIYPITSLTPNLISGGISAINDTSAYVLSAKEPDPFIPYSISASMMSAWTGIDSDINYYLLSGANISGNNGISAEYIPESNKWNIGLDKTNLVTYARFHTSNNTYTASAEIMGFAQDDYIGTDVYLDNAEVYANSGLYHVDIQVEVTIPGNDNNYHNTILKATTAPVRQIQQEIDGSYAHTETISLSYDIRVAADAIKLTYTIEDLPVNTTFFVKDLNVHRVICSLSEIGGSTYQAGDGLLLQNDTFSVDIGDGLEFSGNQIQVKLGDGLKFDENAGVGVKAITINNQVEEVVETVTTIASDLDTKISNNFPPAMITVADADIAAYRNNGCLYGTLFNVNINSEIEIDRSLVGMYIYRVDNDMDVMFGLYEYQPDYPRYNNDDPTQGISGYGRTVPLCDTGIVQLTTATKGFCEFPIKNLNNTIGTLNPETRPSLKSSCMYYATVYLGSNVNAGGLHVGSFSGYTPPFNDIKPGLTIFNDNINCSLTASYSADVSFNDFGFSWKYNNYANYYAGTDNTYVTGNYGERNDGYRFYMQIRNKAQSQGA